MANHKREGCCFDTKTGCSLELQPVVCESEIYYLLKRSRRVFIISCVIESRS